MLVDKFLRSIYFHVTTYDIHCYLQVLSQETGEEIANIQTFVSNSGQGYRGRAQQVIALQNKVRFAIDYFLIANGCALLSFMKGDV